MIRSGSKIARHFNALIAPVMASIPCHQPTTLVVTYLDEDCSQSQWSNAEYKLALDGRCEPPCLRCLAVGFLFRLPSINKVDGKMGKEDCEELTPVAGIARVKELGLARS